MWADVQEAFYILLAQYLTDVLLPVFVAAGVILAFIMPLSRFWEPTQKIELPGWERERGG